MVNLDHLDSLAAAAQSAAATNRLVDITNLSVDALQPPHARIDRFISETENPYMFRIKDTTVRVSFANDGPPLSKLLEEIARMESS